MKEKSANYNCLNCNKEMYRAPWQIRNNENKYCSRKCWRLFSSKTFRGKNHHLYKSKTKRCNLCKKEFIYIPSNQSKKYCSKQCYNWMRMNIYYQISCFECNNLFDCKNDDNYYENCLKKGLKLFCSLSCLIKSRSGEKAPAWRGGWSYKDYGPEFNEKLKKAIRERDNYQCQICFKSIKSLHVHHIDCNKKNNTQMNLISLCVRCHGRQKIPGILIQ